jgi:lumazine binding domain
MQPTSDSIYNIGKRLEQLASLIQATKIHQHPHKQIYTEQEMRVLKHLFTTYELNETVIYEGQVVQIVDVKDNVYYIDLNGETLRATSMDLQKINY